VSRKIAIRLQGLHAGLQLHAVHARLDRYPRKRWILVGTAVDELKQFIHELVMSRPTRRTGSGQA
jgi:hypothetical protein